MTCYRHKPVNAREKRLLAYIAQFNLTLKFVAGSSNRVADCLSRIQADMLSQETEILRPSVREEQADFILSINPFARQMTISRLVLKHRQMS